MTLKRQREAIQAEIECMKYSHTDHWGKYKGQIRPGANRRQWEALQAAKATLQAIQRISKPRTRKQKS